MWQLLSNGCVVRRHLKRHHHLFCCLEMGKLGGGGRIGGVGWKCNTEVFHIFLYVMLFLGSQISFAPTFLPQRLGVVLKHTVVTGG